MPAVIVCAALWAAGPAQAAAPVTDCDRLAAQPFDPGAVAPGVASSAMDAAAAIGACQEAYRKWPGEQRLVYQFARALVKGQRMSEGLSLLRILVADPAYPSAQHLLGFMYVKGWGVTKDLAAGAELLRKAAAKGHPIAASDLGNMYLKGMGVPVDIGEALKLFQASAAAGYYAGEYNLAFLYFKGVGVAQDHARAREWAGKAAEQDYGPAAYLLGKMCVDGLGGGKDYVAAVKWAAIAASTKLLPVKQAEEALGNLRQGLPADVVDEGQRQADAFRAGHN